MSENRRFQGRAKLGHHFGQVDAAKCAGGAEYRASGEVVNGVQEIPSPYIVVDSGPWKEALRCYHHVRRKAVSRGSGSMTMQAADNLLRATAFAEEIDRPLRHHLTIRWPTGDWSLHQPVQQLAAKWLKRNVGGIFYVWTKEGNGGPHSHFLIHLGSVNGGTFRGVIIRGIRRLAGLSRLQKGAVQCRSVNSFGLPAFHTARRAAYLCKGGEPIARMLLGLNKSEISHLCSGKRSGVSQSLGEAARTRVLGAS